ncbi:hypothetical protein [Paenibacillus helianthi]|uniref:hypothetical protein n=1 Tax=Paenibacillus helianthi TaxID=1349432 RepID=UPI000A817DD7|nr:hypothetical protein [Paenibacillus helianthi]
MSKSNVEVAAEIVQSLIQARAAAIAPTTGSRGDFINLYLSDDAIAKTYEAVLKAVNNS